MIEKKDKIQFSTMQLVFGSIVVGAFMIIIGLLFYIKPPTENVQIINILVGAICGSFITIISYYFGSSKSSKDKDEQIINLNKEKV